MNRHAAMTRSPRSPVVRAALIGLLVEALLMPVCYGLASAGQLDGFWILRLVALIAQMPGVLVAMPFAPQLGVPAAVAAMGVTQAVLWAWLTYQVIGRRRSTRGFARRTTTRLDPAGPGHRPVQAGTQSPALHGVPASSWARCIILGALVAAVTLALAEFIEPLKFSGFDAAGSSRMAVLPLRFPGNLFAVGLGLEADDPTAFLFIVQTLFWAGAWRWLISSRVRG